MAAAARALHGANLSFNMETPQTPQSVDSEGSSPGLRWYKRPRRAAQRDHPYEIKSVLLQDQGPRKKRYHHAAFFPFVGGLQVPRGLPDGPWGNWDNVFAVAAEDTVIVARCTNANPLEILFEFSIPEARSASVSSACPVQAKMTEQEELFHVAWTYDPFARHPIIAAAGRGRLIYLFDALERDFVRVLRGHGDEILSLAFSPHEPHILASASADKTIRIWNIFGGDLQPLSEEEKEKLSENFPMADADEGTVAVAILAGEGLGGHRSKVVSVAWHPRNRAVATCGLDRMVKIWALPEFPKPKADEPPTPLGYRPKIIYEPVFSTSRLHDDFVDSIEWICEDVLISRSSEDIISWYWIGYRRFFDPKKYAPIHLEAQLADYHDSHSFMICARYPLKLKYWYMRFGVHHGFKPSQTELETIDVDKRLVTDMLVAIGVEGRAPEIRMFNPHLARPPQPPEPETTLRYESDNESDPDDSANESLSGSKSHQAGARNGAGVAQETQTSGGGNIANGTTSTESKTQTTTTTTKTTVTTTTTTMAMVDSNLSPAELVKLRNHNAMTSASPLAPRQHGTPSKHMTRQLNPMWSLQVKNWSAVVNKSGFAAKAGLGGGGCPITNVAISPRGARWIVGTGEGGSVMVWGFRD